MRQRLEEVRQRLGEELQTQEVRPFEEVHWEVLRRLEEEHQRLEEVRQMQEEVRQMQELPFVVALQVVKKLEEELQWLEETLAEVKMQVVEKKQLVVLFQRLAD